MAGWRVNWRDGADERTRLGAALHAAGRAEHAVRASARRPAPLAPRSRGESGRSGLWLDPLALAAGIRLLPPQRREDAGELHPAADLTDPGAGAVGSRGARRAH